jgi:fucose permease
MPPFHSVTAVTISGAFVFGLLLVLLESLRPMLVKRLALSPARVDWLFSALNLTLIPMMLVSGILLDELGVKSVFWIGSLLTAAAVGALALSGTGSQAFGAILLAGIGGACLSTGSTVLMSRAFFPDNEPASQNLGNIFFGLGALVTPALVNGLVRRLDYRRAVGMLALICLLPALLAAFTEQSGFRSADSVTNLGAVLRNPVLWLAGLVFLLYAPLEGSLGTWATQYLSDRGYRASRAAWFLGGFWLMFLLARLVAALVLEREPAFASKTAVWLIVVPALAAAVFLGNMAGARTRWSGALGLLLVGAFFGPIFPTLVGILLTHFPHERGTAYGAMFAVGAIGNLIVPPFFSFYARRRTVQRALILPLVMALLLALAAMVFGLSLPLFKE